MKTSKIITTAILGVCSIVYGIVVYKEIRDKQKLDDIKNERMRLQKEAAERERRETIRQTEVRKLNELEKLIRNEMKMDGIQYHFEWLNYHLDELETILTTAKEYLTDVDMVKYNALLADANDFMGKVYKEVTPK